MTEIWKAVKNYEGLYEVSNMGNIRNVKGQPRLLKPTLEKYRGGYLRVSLSKNNKKQSKSVHRLVIEAFIGESSLTVNHIDSNKINNCLSNLEYMEREENARIAHSIAILQYDKMGNFIREWKSAAEAERYAGISNANISGCCHKKRPSAGGYVWRFKDEFHGQGRGNCQMAILSGQRQAL